MFSLQNFAVPLHSVHGFLQAEYNVDEDERLDTMFQLNVKGTTQFGSALFVSGEITATAAGTASKYNCTITSTCGILIY